VIIRRKISIAMAKYIYDYPEWPQFTALRDIRDLVEKGMLAPGKPGGRSTDYTLVVQPIL
jgi:Fic family protein